MLWNFHDDLMHTCGSQQKWAGGHGGRSDTEVELESEHEYCYSYNYFNYSERDTANSTRNVRKITARRTLDK